MMKKTAVEWLVEQISSSKYFYKVMEDINSRSTVAQSNIFDQAKAMEKEQIIDCYTEANTELTNEDGSFITGEQYYNETFK
jgi:hypothetical protein